VAVYVPLIYRGRDVFEREPLIFVSVDNKAPKKWITKSEAVWTGPPSMASKIRIERSYPTLQKLFQDLLGIPAAGPGVLVDELQAFAKECGGAIWHSNDCQI
jgi:hypothetical protein